MNTMNQLSSRKRLYKSRDKKVFGVIGGFADYLNLDPTLLRLIFIVFLLFTGIFPGVFAYILFALFMPSSPNGD
jgi:phage shock protein C